MKHLILVRHAKSSWKGGETDLMRSLNDRGRRDAPIMAQRWASRHPAIGLLVSSSALRARTTAEIFADAVAYDREKIEVRQSLYLASASEIVEVIRSVDDALDEIALFGHNPGFTDVISVLADARIDNVPTCGVAEIDLETESWSEFGKSAGRLVEFDYPKRV